MEILKTFINFLTSSAVFMTAILAYLMVNKLWKRKHESAVAERISVLSQLINMIVSATVAINLFLLGKWLGGLDRSLWVAESGIELLIGIGLWVPGRRRTGLWTLLRRAVKSEGNQVGDLAKALFHPASADKVLNILVKIALLDEKLDEREKQYIQAFADEWNINLSWEEVTSIRGNGRHASYTKLRQTMVEYLETSPPANQVSELVDIISRLVKIDDEVSQEEELMVAELQGLITNYLGNTSEGNLYKVAVVPQNPQQEESISSLLPDELTKENIAGGVAYIIGPFYSLKYTEIVCEQFRSLNCFAVAIDELE